MTAQADAARSAKIVSYLGIQDLPTERESEIFDQIRELSEQLSPIQRQRVAVWMLNQNNDRLR